MATKQLDRQVRVNISQDGLKATLSIDAGLDPADVTAELVASRLTDRGIALRPERELAIAEALEAYAAAPNQKLEWVIAEGSPPRHGKDGWVEFVQAPGMSKEAAGHTSGDDPDEAIDHYNRTAFFIVEPGTKLGTLHPPTSGVDGVDVTGRVLAAKNGKPFNLRTDDSVRIGEHGALIATRGGLVEFSGSLLKIVNELHIPGYVDFSTGNVYFPGDVTVDKGVRDCFVVDVGGNLRIRELVEAATIRAVGNCRLDRGMAAREKGTLQVGGTIEANYLDNVRCRVGGDLVIHRELHNCQVVVGGEVRSPSCKVVGGSLVVARQCEVAQVGADAGAVTEVVLGRHLELETLARQALATMPALAEQRQRAMRELDQVKRAVTKLTASQAEQLCRLQTTIAELGAKLNPILDAIDRLCGAIRECVNPTLVVQRMLCAGAKLYIGGFVAEIDQDVKGPLRVSMSAQGEPILVDLTSGHSLDLGKIGRVSEDPRYLDLDQVASRVAMARAA